MANQIRITEKLLQYLRKISLREDSNLRQLRDETRLYPMGSEMQVMAEEGQLLEFLAKLISARNALEIGTFTGYSTLCIAKGMSPHGRLITCDISQKWPAIAYPFWERAGVENIIESRVGDATDLIIDLLNEVGPNYMDFIFIDANKSAYGAYYELGLRLLREGGLMAIDNTLYAERAIHVDRNDADARAIQDLNKRIHSDERVDLTVLPMADGITLVRKIGQ